KFSKILGIILLKPIDLILVISIRFLVIPGMLCCVFLNLKYVNCLIWINMNSLKKESEGDFVRSLSALQNVTIRTFLKLSIQVSLPVTYNILTSSICMATHFP